MLQLQFVFSLFIIGLLRLNNAAENEIHLKSEENPNDVLNLTALGNALLGQPDYSITERMIDAYENHSDDDLPNPEELGTYFEGDLLIPETNDNDNLRNGMLAQSSRWPGGRVPYEIRGEFTTNERSYLTYAFAEYKKRTCIEFYPRKSERDYISIESSATGCWSSIGRMGGKQIVNLQTNYCFRKPGTTLHELAHALGFFHEQSRYERDSYVSVLKENVVPEMLQNFGKNPATVSSGFGVPYDYASVMHYSPTSFSKNRKPTMIALRNTPEAKLMGQRNGFSQGDVDKINAMYRCRK